MAEMVLEREGVGQMSARRLFSSASGLLFAFVLLGIWQALADARLVSPAFFPSPVRTFNALFHQIETGDIWPGLVETCWRMLVGWFAASLAGVILGAAIGLSQRARDFFEPTLEFVRPLPASAIVPVAILLLGLTNQMIISVIAFGAIWPVLLNTVHGFKTVEPRLNEVARMLHLTPLERSVKIALPSALPDILAGVRVSLAISLILAVVAEILSSQPGLGHNVHLAARAFRSAELYAGIVVMGVLGYVTNAALERAEAHWLRWRRHA